MLVVVLSLVVSFAVEPASSIAGGDAQQQASLGEMRRFIVEKLDYDAEYFAKVVNTKGQGRTLPGLTGGAWQAEVTRATRNLPVLERFVSERASYDAGRPFTLPKDITTFREYANLLALLNMFQGHAMARPADVIQVGDAMSVRSPDDFGKVRGARADYYVAMFRAYFYLMGSAHYALRHDDKAVEWFARLQADANLVELKKKIETREGSAAESAALTIEKLRGRPLAFMPLTNNTGDDRLAFATTTLPEVLTGDLVQGSDLVVVERAQLDKLASEEALALGGFTTPGAANKTGTLLGAGTLIVGSLARDGAGVLLSLRIVETDKETVIAAASGPVRTDALFEDARKVLLGVLQQIGWDSGILAEDFLSRHAPRADTARKLHEARLLRATQGDAAKALYAQAIREDPALANLYVDAGAHGIG